METVPTTKSTVVNGLLTTRRNTVEAMPILRAAKHGRKRQVVRVAKTMFGAKVIGNVKKGRWMSLRITIPYLFANANDIQVGDTLLLELAKKTRGGS